MQAQKDRSSLPEVFFKKGFLRNFAKFTWKHLCQSLFFQKSCRPQAYNFIQKETLELVFSCGFCEISKNILSYRTPLLVASQKKRKWKLTYKHNNKTLIQPVQQKQLPRRNLKNICFQNARNIHGKCSRITTGWKISKFEVFLFVIFPYSDWTRRLTE